MTAAAAEMLMVASDRANRARAIAVDLEQTGAEAERLLRKVVVLACEHGIGLVLSEQAQDALEFLCRDVA